MDPDAKWPVLIVLLCLAGVLYWSILDVRRNSRLAQDQVDQVSVGWEMRSWFHILLSAALGLRILALLLEICLPGNALQDSETAECWVVGFAHGIPDVLFLGTFSLLTLQFSQLYSVFKGKQYSHLRRNYIAMNSTVLGAFLVSSLASHTCVTFRVRTFLLLGLAYGVGALFMMYFGLRFGFELRRAVSTMDSAAQRGGVDDDDGYEFEFEQRATQRRRVVLHRVLFLCSTCTFVFVLRSVYCTVAGSTLSGTLGYPPGVRDRFAFESIGYLVAEVVPSVIALLLTSPTSEGDESSEDLENSEDEAYPEAMVGSLTNTSRQPLLQSYQQAVMNESHSEE